MRNSSSLVRPAPWPTRSGPAPGGSAPMAGPGLTGAASPPLLLPASHFVAGLAFFASGAAGLVLTAPELAAGRFLMPKVVATTHFLTLGWITTSIMGALYQLLPVVVGVPVWSRRLAYAALGLHVPGLMALGHGLMAGQSTPMLVGAALLGLGLLAFIANVGVTLAKAPGRGLTWWCLAGALFFLLATAALGVTLAGNLRWPVLGGERLVVVATHVHIALGGWVLLVVIGVARRLLPMFLLSHGVGERGLAAAAALVGAAAMGLTLLHHVVPMAAWPWIAATLWLGTAVFLAQAVRIFRHRKRPALDAGMRLAGSGLAFLALGLLLAPAVFGPASGSLRIATAYGLAVVLGFGLFVAGHYYKILPFLVWYHRFGPLAGKRPLPRVSDLFDARLAAFAAVVLPLGAAALIAAVLAGHAALARAAAAVLLSGVLMEAVQMIGVLRRRPS